MKVDLEFLKLKKEILIQEAEKLLSIQNNVEGNDHNYLVKSIVNERGFIKGNLPFCFVQKCIKHTDDIFDLTHKEKEQNYRCDVMFSDDVIKMWQNMDRKYKKVKPERGDIVIGHYIKQNALVTNGFVGLIRSVDSNLVVETIEASVISPNDDDQRALQFDGIKVRHRPLNTKGKCRILGVFTPWFF